MTLKLCRECLGDATHSTGAFDFHDVCERCLGHMALCSRGGHSFKPVLPVHPLGSGARDKCEACGFIRIPNRDFLNRVWRMLK